jgi:hypothetical protein
VDGHATEVPGAAIRGYPIGLDPIPESATARSAELAAERLPVHFRRPQPVDDLRNDRVTAGSMTAPDLTDASERSGGTPEWASGRL